jgi:NADH dehydrogenase [ubiquinone] 1 alpha subcomplex assembly factor 1
MLPFIHYFLIAIVSIAISEQQETSSTPNDPASPTETILIDFSETVANSWQIVNDNVMGGISRSSFRMHGDGYAVFSGTVSLENNGGFASVRVQARSAADLSEFKGLSVRVFGDGKTYCLRLRTVENGRLTWYSYETRFRTKIGEWETYFLPFSDFKAEFRGTPVRGNPKLNADAVAEIGFMIQDKQEGSFRLGVSKLSGYR